MPDYTNYAEGLLQYVMAFGNTTMSTHAIKMGLMEAFEAGLNAAPAPAQPVAAPPVVVSEPATVLDSEVLS